VCGRGQDDRRPGQLGQLFDADSPRIASKLVTCISGSKKRSHKEKARESAAKHLFSDVYWVIALNRV
jgi:hypothetical protein